jgi:hypothetical protein
VAYVPCIVHKLPSEKYQRNAAGCRGTKLLRTHCGEGSSGTGRKNELDISLPLYTFRMFDGKQSVTSDAAISFIDAGEAWIEMVKVCADLVVGGVRNLKPDSVWHLELLNAAQEPLFRINLTAKSL